LLNRRIAALKDKSYKDVIGLIPAAGHAVRMGYLPCSKELLPLGIDTAEDQSEPRYRVIISYLLEALRSADTTKAFIILRKGKWDIPGYLGDGSDFNMHIGYLMQGLPYAVPYTLDQAFPFMQQSIAALGFPDILYKDNDIFSKMLSRLKEGDLDIVLGLFPADKPQNADGVEYDDDMTIRRVVPKPHDKKHQFVWAAAVWKPIFTRFMHDYLAHLDPPTHGQNELQIGHVIQQAIIEGQRVAGVHVSKYPPIDVGTPENFKTVVSEFNKRQPKNHA
jgi:glucose-1-phosphate thymidylyltransferase